ncbi:MAG: extracellular solute-binding protein [Chamaesiphon sp.]|nr:extracellular solute-binding protein [Chamaesiphon sp.]
MNRRSFLTTLTSLALGSGLTSCQDGSQQVLRLLALKGSIPSQLVGEFSKSIQPISARVELVTESQFKEIITQLQEWHKTGKAEAKGLKIPLVPPTKSPEYIPNLVSLGDTWLATAIQEKSIQPIDPSSLKNWDKLDSRWHELAQRDDRGNSSSTGKVWGVPFRWGTTVILYRRDKFLEANITIPTDWADLWNPQLKQRISLLDRSREVIGLTLKKLGSSYNTTDLSQSKNLKLDLQKLHQQVKFYSSDNYLQPLIMGDTWAAVAWSSDAIDLIQRNPTMGAIVPRSGTAIFADLWVQPSLSAQLSPAEKLLAENSDRVRLTNQWIDYCLQPKVVNQISLLTSSGSPLLTSMNPSEIIPDIRKNSLILPPKDILSRSEFIYPLPAKSQSEYDRLWQEIRNIKVI